LGYVTATADELYRNVAERGYTPEEIDRAWAVLRRRDPAGVVTAVRREDVARVAIHLTGLTGSVPVPSPWFKRILDGHPAAHAIFVHEFAEMAELARAGYDDPSRLMRGGAEWFRAHALAAWVEADYWRRWADNLGEDIPAEAFLRGHPARSPGEVDGIRRALEREGIALSPCSAFEVRRAHAFCRRHGL
jgi:hypothetical protein